MKSSQKGKSRCREQDEGRAETRMFPQVSRPGCSPQVHGPIHEEHPTFDTYREHPALDTYPLPSS
eukprot:209031-Amphidinium_carterae.1